MTPPDSNLDLSKPVGGAPAATAAPVDEVVGDLVLTPPAAVPAVPKAQASSMMPVDPQTANALSERADNFVAGLIDMDPRAPEFQKKVRDITTMGDKDIRASSEVSNRMLQRPMKALEAAQGKGQEGDAQRLVANELVSLRQTVEDLDPSKVDSMGPKKLLGIIPFGSKIRDYFDKYKSAENHIDQIIVSLKNGQDELRKDNAAIEGEKVNLWNSMQKMQEYATLAADIDGALEARISDIELTDPEKAKTLKADLLFAVRQKHQDLLTQLAVSAQGYLALDMVRRNNLELIKGVDRATTTTISALRTAITVAQALANQKLVLDQITALNTTTSNLIVATSEMLKQQTGEIHNQAASTTVSMEALQQSFSNIYATMDAIDTFKADAVENMADTVGALQTELTKANAYIDRARNRDDSIGELPN